MSSRPTAEAIVDSALAERLNGVLVVYANSDTSGDDIQAAMTIAQRQSAELGSIVGLADEVSIRNVGFQGSFAGDMSWKTDHEADRYFGRTRGREARVAIDEALLGPNDPARFLAHELNDPSTLQTIHYHNTLASGRAAQITWGRGRSVVTEEHILLRDDHGLLPIVRVTRVRDRELYAQGAPLEEELRLLPGLQVPEQVDRIGSVAAQYAVALLKMVSQGLYQFQVATEGTPLHEAERAMRWAQTTEAYRTTADELHGYQYRRRVLASMDQTQLPVGDVVVPEGAQKVNVMAGSQVYQVSVQGGQIEVLNATKAAGRQALYEATVRRVALTSEEEPRLLSALLADESYVSAVSVKGARTVDVGRSSDILLLGDATFGAGFTVRTDGRQLKIIANSRSQEVSVDYIVPLTAQEKRLLQAVGEEACRAFDLGTEQWRSMGSDLALQLREAARPLRSLADYEPTPGLGPLDYAARIVAFHEVQAAARQARRAYNRPDRLLGRAVDRMLRAITL